MLTIVAYCLIRDRFYHIDTQPESMASCSATAPCCPRGGVSTNLSSARRPCGEFVWVLQGRHSHHARLSLPKALTAEAFLSGGEVEIWWQDAAYFDMVSTSLIVMDCCEPSGRRSRTAVASDGRSSSRAPQKGRPSVEQAEGESNDDASHHTS